MKQITLFLALILVTVFLPGCGVIEGIFKAGVWVGVLAVVGVIALIIFAISKMGGKK